MIGHGRKIALLTVLAVLLTALVPMAGLASVKGRRNTAIGLTAGTLYSAIRGHTGTAIVLGAGSAYAWKRAHDERVQNQRRAYYNSGRYGYSSYSTYGSGTHHRYHAHRHYKHGRHTGWSHSKYYNGYGHK